MQGERGVTTDAEARPSTCLGNPAELWTNLQWHYSQRFEPRALKEQIEAIAP